MPTIKTKKEMNLGELLCWAIDNKEQASLKDFYSKNIGVKFNASGYPCIEFEKKFLPTYETFTVEIEEPITEDTVLDAVVIVRKQISPYDRESTHVCRKGNVSINQVLSLQPNNSRFVYLEIHLMKNDRIDQLIWTTEKGLVE